MRLLAIFEIISVGFICRNSVAIKSKISLSECIDIVFGYNGKNLY